MQDVFAAVRQFRKFPGFVVVVVLTIALGIGANTAIFTLVHAVLLRSLPVSDPGALYRVGDGNDQGVSGGFMGDAGDFDLFSYDLYLHLRGTTPAFSQLAAMQSGSETMNVRRGAQPAREQPTEYVSGNYFTTLGIGPFAGRLLNTEDGREGAAPTAVLSCAAWQADYGSDPHVVGQTFYFQGQPVTVVGIAPSGFYGDRIQGTPPALWISLAAEPVIEGKNSLLRVANSNWLDLLGRVRPDTSIAALQAQMSAGLRDWLATQPSYTVAGGSAIIPKQHVVIVPGGQGIRDLQIQTEDGLYLLMAISALVLLVACANVANLLLARGSTRRAETSLRMALGAARSRLIRQILTESVLLGCLGGLAGVALAYGGTRMILALAFPDTPQLPISPNPSLPVLAFAFLLSLATGVVFGIVPAWITTKADPAEALRGISRATRDRASLPQRSLIVFQVALSLVLLVSAGLLTRSLSNLQNQHFGIETANRYVIHIDPAGAGYTAAQIPAFDQALEQRFRALPGVTGVGLALYSPLEQNRWAEGVFIPGRLVPARDVDISSMDDRVSPDFFRTVGQPILQGRAFTQDDNAASQPVAIVNQAFVKKFFPHENPIGRSFGIYEQKDANAFRIVGIVADAKYVNPDQPQEAMYFRTLTQTMAGLAQPNLLRTENSSLYIDSVILRFAVPPQHLDATVRRTLAEINPNLTVVNLHSLAYQVAGNFDQNRLVSRLAGLFGLLALLLAAVGLYGITSYQVARRTSEIGLRMALGANRAHVVRMVLRQAFGQVGLGLAIGIPAALLGAHALGSQLYGVRSYDPASLLLAIAALSLAAAVAGLIPARRAAGVEPVTALRSE